MELPVSRLFSIKNFGCRATQADGAAIAADLAERGLLRVDDPSRADVVVVNTCTVTSEADRDARKVIRRIHRERPNTEILVTGCYAQRRPDELAALGGVKWVVGNSHKHRIGEVLAPSLVQIDGSAPQALSYHGQLSAGGTLVGDIARPGGFPVTPVGDPLGRSRPNVKVQDGCDNRCAFCIIPSVRGRSRSASSKSIIEDVRSLQAEYPELVLTGINLGRWGRDLEGRPRLVELLKLLLENSDVRRLRLSSIEPMDWSPELLTLMASSPRIAKHVHMPLQSGSDIMLRKMRRRYRVRHYQQRLLLARRMMPSAAIGADVMVGFPGESAAHFEETKAFVERMPFTYLHVFSYSPRPGTEAVEFKALVPKAVKQERNRLLRELIERKNRAFREEFIGSLVSAVVLSSNARGARVLSENFLDIELPKAQLAPGSLVTVRIEQVDGAGTRGSLAGCGHRIQRVDRG